MVCNFPNCIESKTDMHHVTYTPPRTIPLCRKHHTEITDINTSESLRTGKLSSERRSEIFEKWIAGRYEVILGISWMHENSWVKGHIAFLKNSRCNLCYAPILGDFKKKKWKCVNKKCVRSWAWN